eukprot:513878-Prorocentrum_minimum.AAC.1
MPRRRASSKFVSSPNLNTQSDPVNPARAVHYFRHRVLEGRGGQESSAGGPGGGLEGGLEWVVCSDELLPVRAEEDGVGRECVRRGLIRLRGARGHQQSSSPVSHP